ncbi:MAG: VIT family protein [Chitinophagales bacterium]|nr:VIT family protein [Chitinophagales bacterium]
MTSLDNYLSDHYIHRSNWLRAAVLGANDGIISVSSLAIGIVASNTSRENIIIATVASLIAGALSMSAGEYVSVSSQKDTEKADIAREAKEIQDQPDVELLLLAKIYEDRGLSPQTALIVATELMDTDALGAHVRDELGINEITEAKPLQAALASGAAFIAGGLLPLIVTLFAPLAIMEYLLYAFSIVFLITLGIVSAKIGGSKIGVAILRITIWGTLAMGVSALIGYWLGVTV